MKAIRRLSIQLCAPVCAVVGLAGAATAQDGDPAMGERVFTRCSACHSLEADTHLVGPSLSDLWGRVAGSLDGFENYSDAMKASGIVWMPDTLDPYLENVQETVPGTNMAFPGLSNPEHRAHLIAYFIELFGAPPDDAETGDGENGG